MSIKILIADDSHVSISVLTSHINSFGYSLIGTATSSLEAIQLSDEMKPDIAILDLFMPGMNGDKATEIIQSKLGIPVILITGDPQESSLTNMLCCEPAGIIIKPINKSQLKSTIDLIIKKEIYQRDLRRYKQIVQRAPMRIALIDINYKYRVINDAYCRSFELEEKKIVGSTIAEIMGLEVFRTIVKPQIDRSLSGETIHYESWISYSHDGKRYMSIDYYPYTEQKDIQHGVVVIANDITQLKVSEEKLKKMSTTDQLTGLHNRRNFLDLLENEILRSARFEKPFTLLSLDIDDFKSINDQYGHQAGDACLVHFSSLLATTIRGIDSVGRIGGEEFSILLPETNARNTPMMLDRLISTMNNNHLDIKGFKKKITASIGVATFPTDGTSSEELLHNADVAMYQAKKNGKNQFYFFSKR